MFPRIISSPLGGIRGGLLLFLCIFSLLAQAARKVEPTVVAYVTSWTQVVPDPQVMTHLNYAFGHVNDTFNGVRIDNPDRLRQMVALKKQQPKLRVMLSVGGWGSGRFSEMAASEENRLRFAADCRRVCDEFQLDGIDIDWEYPTQKSAGISCSPDDTRNFTLLMRDLRQALGNKRWLTIATVCSAQYIDFPACIQYLDMVNVMSYDMGNPPKHHATLHRSELTGWMSADEAIQAHIKAGVPREKLNMGMPFYGRGKVGGYLKKRDELRHQYTECWDAVAQVPYLLDGSGQMVLGYDNARSLAAKCRYAKEQGLRGAMYWEYGDDNDQGDERRTLWRNILQSDKDRNKACSTAARQLAAALEADVKREDISPDSFFCDVRRMKAEVLAEQDPTAQAIRRAILAHRLCQNSWRSQAGRRLTVSHPDSIQEWSQEEYIAHAADLYADALADMDALHGISLKDVKPLVHSGKDDGIFRNDILYLIWQCAVQDVTADVRRKHFVPDYKDVIDVYRRHGLREATLWLRLDSLNFHEPTEATLLRLRDEYADLPACAQVYLRLADVPGKKPAEQYRILEEGLKRYPKSREAGELSNRMALLRQPVLSGQFHGMYYPERDYDIPLKVKNMRSGQILVYRLPADFAYDDKPKAAPLHEQIRQRGTLVQTLPIAQPSADPLETKEDTLRWHTPGFGRYALVLDGSTPEKLADGYQPEVVMAGVSALTYMTTTLPDGKRRVMVTDAMTGAPQQDVLVGFWQEDADKPFRSQLTDKRGIVEVALDGKERTYITIQRDDDNAHDQFFPYWFTTSRNEVLVRHQLNLYTDRAIYRPGQMVYVGGIAHIIDHEKGTQAEADADIKLTCIAANGEELASHTLRTDAFGTLSDSILLPKNVLPGQFRISTGNRSVWFRVEEYRRPTFEVKMDTPAAISLPADSITLSGRAITYSQWPVGNARVTGTYYLEDIWWLHRYGQRESHRIDTLRTDAEGRFSVTVPIAATRGQLKYGQTLCLTVSVLSPEGETQQGLLRVPLCTEPLRLSATIPGQQNRESLRPWHFDLISSNNQPVQGDILCILSAKGKEACRFTLKANHDSIPAQLLTLPSGQYDLMAKAEVKGDTASCKATFTIFSITDRRLQGKHDLWLYAPDDTIAPGHTARFQIGTSLPEAWIYCLVAGEQGIERDTILHLQDEAMLLEIPYEARFQHHLTVSLMLIHQGKSQTASTDFRYAGPDKRLRMQWNTFRNYLEPGQKEHWQLTLTRPDGTPAPANVLVGMYDASLDALASYAMPFTNPMCARSNYLHIRSCDRFVRNRYYIDLGLPLRLLPYEGYDFASWLEPAVRTYGMKAGPRHNVRVRGLASMDNAVYETRVMREVAAPMAMDKATTEELSSRAADDSEASADGGSAVPQEAADAVQLRENLSELAFFYPQLRTDGKGQVSIDFTLPDGLTSWHLHGLAHTQDMMTARWEETIVARKQLMAELTLPRFLRNGDEAALTATVRNASEVRQKGEAVLDVYCTEDNWSVKHLKVRFDLQPGADTVYHFPIRANLDHPVLTVQWVAKSRLTSDGELRYLPILSDMQNVTETRTYMLRGDTALTLPLTNLFAHGNPKAVGRSLTVEHFTDPMYLALQALPSLAAPVRRDVLSVASALYGGIVSYRLSRQLPDVRKAIEAWAQSENSTHLESPLVKNQQLADIVLNETPWLREAHEQKASRLRIVSLMDEMQQRDRRTALFNALLDRQLSDGSFGWFPQMRGNAWLTTEVATLLVRLGQIRGSIQTPEQQMLDRALGYLDKGIASQVKSMREEKSPQLTLAQLRYLYIYIMCGKEESDNSRYLLSLLRKQADKLDREERALAAIVLSKAGQEKQAKALMPRLHELLRHADGMHLDYPGGSFASIDCKVQAHVHLMEAVMTVEPDQKDLLARMAEWLILQKRTQEWEQPIQTADAVYALLQSGLKGGNGEWRGRVSYDHQTRILQAPEPFVGCVRERIDPISQPKELYMEQRHTDGKVSWGAVYAQYQLPAAEAEAHREGMTIRREVCREGGAEADGLRQGDALQVRYTLTVDRDYEYVCLRAPRLSAAEPKQQLSGYRWQNGVGYYQAQHDASTDYYFDRLPRGTYVIEEGWQLTRTGSFLLPPARLTCLYAPEFQSQTAGAKVSVK